MKTIKVAAAIIKKDNKILIASRKTGEFAGMFEFPGGKVEPGETSKQALIREIQEELETSINIDEFFMNVNYTYPTFILDMDCFICSIKTGNFVLKEHQEARWLTKETLDSVEWLPADQGLIEKLKEYL